MNATVAIDAGNHQVLVGDGSLQILKDFISDFQHPLYVLCDEHTYKLCFPHIQSILPAHHRKIVIGAGERNKNLHTCQVVWEQLLESGADRKSLIINLGGGMVTDLGGFAASAFMRGISFFNIPTSLMSMIDASVGGKTGIDLGHYKNMVGAFAFPEQVFIAPLFLDTLPEREWKNGVAEMLKHGLIGSADHWERIVDALASDSIQEQRRAIKNLIPDSIKIKAEIVRNDPREEDVRKLLNFGHTIGHALESWSLDNDDFPLSHGEAVAIGMICESFISVKLTGLPVSTLNEISSVITKTFPHYDISRDSISIISNKTRHDKKNESGDVRLTLLNDIGEGVINVPCEFDLIDESLKYYQHLKK